MRSFKICVFNPQALNFSVTVGATTYSDTTVTALKAQLDAVGANAVIETGGGNCPLTLLALRGASVLSEPVTFSYETDLGSSEILDAVALSVHDAAVVDNASMGLAGVALLATLVGRLTA